MNTNQLLSFLTLAETNSYQKAAEQLHYSSSTVMDHGHLVRLCKETGVHIVPTQYIDSKPLLKHFVLHHDCVSMLSRRVIAEELERGELVELPLAPEPLLTDVVALYPPRGEKNPALQDFIRLTIRQLN